MHGIGRGIAGICVTAVAVAALSACGGSSSNERIVQIAGVASISKAALEHWMPVEAVVLYEERPTKPVPKGLIPDPPDYKACMAYLAAKAPTLTSPQLNLRCRQRNAEVRTLTLNTLISWYWTIGSAEAVGFKASDAEIKRWYLELGKLLFKSNRELANYMKWTGQTTPDMLLRAKVQLYELRLAEKLTAAEKQLPKSLSPAQRQAAISKLTKFASPSSYWPSRTTCRPGFVVSACREYKGPFSPGLPN